MKITNDDFWEIIKYNYDQIRYAEIKSSVVISVYSLFLTIAYTIDILDEENVYQLNFESIWDFIPLAIFIPILYFTIQSFINCIRCFLPRFNQSTLKSPLFFGDIANHYKNFDDYKDELKNLINRDHDEYQEHLTHMVYVTGVIAFTKFQHVNKAIKSLIKSILCFILYLIIIFLFKLI